MKRSRLFSISFHLPFHFLLALAMLFAGATSAPSAEGKKAASPEQDLAITAEVMPTARQKIREKVLLLPIIEPDGSLDKRQTLSLRNALEYLEKYKFISSAAAEKKLRKKAHQTKGRLKDQDLLDMGRALQASAVITGQIQKHSLDPLDLLTNSGQGRGRACLVRMLDCGSGKLVWKLQLTIPPKMLSENGSPNPWQNAIEQLRKEMVAKGDLYSALLPQPEILSTQGDIRSTRIVVQPDPPYVFTEYQLLGADRMDGVFKPVGKRIKNKAPIVFNVKNLADDTTYYYTVLGFSPQGFANIPGPPFAIKTAGPPKPLIHIKATGGGLRQIQLSWTPSQDPTVNGYIILRSNSKSGPFSRIATLKGRDKQTYTDRGEPSTFSRYGALEDDTTYYYTIRTRNVVGVESANSPVVSAKTKGAPEPVTGLQAISGQPRRVPLLWKRSSDPDVKGYGIFRSQKKEGPFLQIDFVSGIESQQYVDTGRWNEPLTDNTTYYYRVRAINVVNVHSPDTDPVAATTKAAPAPVKGFTARSGLLRSVQLSWQANPEPDIVHYEIFRGASPETIRHRIAKVEGALTEYTDQDLENGQLYFYQIRAVDQDGLRGPLSSSIQAMTKKLPMRPVGLQVRLEPGRVLLSWQANPEKDIDHYEITTSGFFSGQTFISKEPMFLYSEKSKSGEELTFRVRAVDADGLKSESSAPLQIVIP